MDFFSKIKNSLPQVPEVNFSHKTSPEQPKVVQAGEHTLENLSNTTKKNLFLQRASSLVPPTLQLSEWSSFAQALTVVAPKEKPSTPQQNGTANSTSYSKEKICISNDPEGIVEIPKRGVFPIRAAG